MSLHLDSGPRDPSPLCGAEGETTNEITEVDCPACESEHEEHDEGDDAPCCRAQVTAGRDSGQHEPGCYREDKR